MMPKVKEFEVLVTRSASETATLKVKAKSQEAAEGMISGLLDQPHRVDLREIEKAKGVKVVDLDFYPDDESSWEVM